jgi:hypothetical protein
MVAHTIEQLVGAGMPVEHIRYEQFDDVGAGDTAVAVAVGTGESK